MSNSVLLRDLTIFVIPTNILETIKDKQNLENMRNIRFAILPIIILISTIAFAQQPKNSETRSFIDSAEFTQVNRDWNNKAEFTSGLGEVVSFFPVEAIDLKTNSKIKALQIDMDIIIKGNNYFKTSWIDLSEISEFIYFIEQYVLPNLDQRAQSKQSTTYIFNSKEIRFSFHIGNSNRRISIYLKDSGVTDYINYFWTETQVSEIPDLLNVLKQLK